jgi:hypothetical protein
MNTRLSHGAVLAVILSCPVAGCATDARQGDSGSSPQPREALPAREAQPARAALPAPTAPPAVSGGDATQSKIGAPPTNADAALLEDFKDRIDAYMKVHDRQEKGNADPKETSDPAKIKATQDALAAKIQAARKDAKPGDIFTPEIRQLFRRLMSPEMKGPDATETKQAIKLDEGTPAKSQVLNVNGRYPEAAPLPTVPPNLLARLPQLPEELEYRFVNKDLILRDVNANLIVDFIPNALR